LVGKPEEERSLEKLGRRCQDSIIMDLKETWWEGVEGIEVAQDRIQWVALVNTVMNFCFS
jgi:hypothetical protein